MPSQKKSQQQKQLKDGGELNSILAALALTVGAVAARKKILPLPVFKGGAVEGSASSLTSSGCSIKGGANKKSSKPKRKVTKRGGEGHESVGAEEESGYGKEVAGVAEVAEVAGGGAKKKSPKPKRKVTKRGGEGEDNKAMSTLPDIPPSTPLAMPMASTSTSAMPMTPSIPMSSTMPDSREPFGQISEGGSGWSKSMKGKKRGGNLPSLIPTPPSGGPIPGVGASTGQSSSQFIMPRGGGTRKSSAKKVTQKQGGAPDLRELLKTLRNLA